MSIRDVVVIGASAGGIDALRRIAETLPADLTASILIVQHLHSDSPGILPDILNAAGPLPASHPKHGAPIRPGELLVAPPDCHMLLSTTGEVLLSRGPKENRVRPAIDPLFRSAALAFGPRVVGIVLSGHLDDGSSGLRAIKMAGGTAVVQDPAEAEVPSMPRNALAQNSVDHVVRLQEIGPLIDTFSRTEVSFDEFRSMIMPKEIEIEAAIAAGDDVALAGVKTFGEPSLFTCPDCHGTLVELRDKHPIRFRCHTGHAFTALTLREALEENSENALWSAVRTLQERAMLMAHLAKHARGADQAELAQEWEREAELAKDKAEQVRRIHTGDPGP